MRLAIVLLVATLFGCDDGPRTVEEPADRLLGRWFLQENSDCAAALVFNGDDTYELDRFCRVEGNTVDAQAVGGDYVATDTKVTFKSKRGSCKEADAKDTVARYAFPTSMNLALVYSDGALSFEPLPEPTGTLPGFAYTFGCFLEDGTFDPRKVEDF